MSQRIQLATQTGRYPALRGVVDNPEQYHADLQKIANIRRFPARQEDGERAPKYSISFNQF